MPLTQVTPGGLANPVTCGQPHRKMKIWSLGKAVGGDRGMLQLGTRAQVDPWAAGAGKNVLPESSSWSMCCQ